MRVLPSLWICLAVFLAQVLCQDPAAPIGAVTSQVGQDGAWTGSVETDPSVTSMTIVPIVSGNTAPAKSFQAAVGAPPADLTPGHIYWTFEGKADPNYNGFILQYGQAGAQGILEYPAASFLPMGPGLNPFTSASSKPWIASGTPVTYAIIAVAGATVLFVGMLLWIASKNRAKPMAYGTGTLGKGGSLRSRPSVTYKPDVEEIVVEAPSLPIKQHEPVPSGSGRARVMDLEA
ncbi:hypothetical protein SpCBS45565_g03375 [Spizellomyces sp. 'palustris']|nr:hypothetical protein SpCBS45565_g03375 [Spizellomyces sp. 'palustris']